MPWLEHLLRTVKRAGGRVRQAPRWFEHRTRHSLTEYVGALVVLGAIGLAAASVGVA
jgi:hypothetical protein